MTRLSLVLCAALLAACSRNEVEHSATNMTGGGVPDRGKSAIEKYGCGSCHTIPGVEGATGVVGPSLDKLANRTHLAGRMQNTPANLMDWIRHPQQHDSKTVMPNMGVTPEDARDIAAYLYTLR